MANRSVLVAMAVASAVGLTTGTLATGKGGDTNKHISLSNTELVVTHGDWRISEDGGTRFTVCGYMRRPDGGIAHLEVDCASCEGLWAGAPSTCAAAWKKANGIEN